MVMVKGRLQIFCEIIVDENENIPRDAVKERMREDVWRMVYKELLEPLWKLSRLASIYVPPAHQEEVLALRKQLDELLTRKSPNDKSSHGAGRKEQDAKQS